MRVLYLTPTGHAYSDEIGLSCDNIQEPDGIHPLSNNAIYTDDNKRESVMFISARNFMPEGEDKSFENVSRKMFERFLMIIARRRHRVSRIFYRKMMMVLKLVLRSFYCAFFLIIIGFFIFVGLVLL